MPRPRRISDDDILSAAIRVMQQVPPAEFTLALVGREAGLAPATLLQRFGSKLGLLEAVARAGVDGMAKTLVAVRARHASPVRALEAYLAGFALLAPNADALANNLAYLQMDLLDPSLRAQTRAMFEAHELALHSLLDDAVQAGELRELDTAAVARTLLSVAQGALIVWGVYRTGRVRDALAQEIRAVLQPYRGGN